MEHALLRSPCVCGLSIFVELERQAHPPCPCAACQCRAAASTALVRLPSHLVRADLLSRKSTDLIRTGDSAAAHLVSTSLSVDHSDYHYAANLHVNMIFARALALAGGLREENDGEGLRASFRAAWKPEIDAWRLRWSEVSTSVFRRSSLQPSNCDRSRHLVQTPSLTYTPRT